MEYFPNKSHPTSGCATQYAKLRAKCTGFPQVGERAGGQGWKGGGLGTHKEKAAREGKGAINYVS